MSNEVKSFTPKQLWSKTMPFVWAKLTLRLVAILIGAAILAISIWIFTANEAIGFFAIIFGLIASISIYGFVVRVFGYAVRVGHIAVLVETIKTGSLPDNQLIYGKKKVVEKFKTAAVFFVLDRLVDRAVQQLQRALGSVAGLLGGMPGMGSVVKFAQKVLGIALKYVDECCIGWIFYNDDKNQSATKGAIDGIVIYFQNWKRILGDALKTALLVVIFTFVLFLALLAIFAWLLSFVGGGFWTLLAVFLGLMIALAVKKALIDSWVMIRMLSGYMAVAPSTEIKFDVYGKLSGLSPSFRQLCDQAKGEIINSGGSNTTTTSTPAPTSPPAAAPSSSANPVFCGECGSKNSPGTQFCGECGSKI